MAGTIEGPESALVPISSRRLLVGDFFVGWVYGPWVAAAALALLALRLLLLDDFALHSQAWGLFGNAAICFSIGCVCKVSWGLARGNALRQLEIRLRQELGLR
jgi:hypothetical protein